MLYGTPKHHAARARSECSKLRDQVDAVRETLTSGDCATVVFSLQALAEGVGACQAQIEWSLDPEADRVGTFAPPSGAFKGLRAVRRAQDDIRMDFVRRCIAGQRLGTVKRQRAKRR